jgi:hypothetical protein
MGPSGPSISVPFFLHLAYASTSRAVVTYAITTVSALAMAVYEHGSPVAKSYLKVHSARSITCPLPSVGFASFAKAKPS